MCDWVTFGTIEREYEIGADQGVSVAYKVSEKEFRLAIAEDGEAAQEGHDHWVDLKLIRGSILLKLFNSVNNV